MVVYSEDGKRLVRADSTLRQFKIPDSVTSIDDWAFHGCIALTSIEIPDSVTSIGARAFFGCTGLTSIKIPDSVTSIGPCAFDECTALMPRLLLYNNSTTCYGWVGDNASCVHVEIPNSVTHIDTEAFFECSSLTSIEIPDSVTQIGSCAFYGCSSLTTIEIPNSVTSIGYRAFSKCISLKPHLLLYNNSTACYGWVGDNASCLHVEIPQSVTYIDNWAFEGCLNLTSIKIPDSVISIRAMAFRSDDVIRPRLNIEPHLLLYNNNSVCYGWVGNTSQCISIKIPNSVTSIGDHAFEGCRNLTSIVIPNSVTSIGSYAFSDCYSLTSIEIPNSVTSIENCAFKDCHNLTSIEIPNSVTSIGSYAFSDCYSLTSIEIPNSVISIGDEAFKECHNLTSIEIPNSVTSVGARAFFGCSGLTSIEIPNSVTSIGDEAFCENGDICRYLDDDFIISTPIYRIIPLSNIKPHLLLYNNNTACYGWVGALSVCISIKIPNTVTTIGARAFSECSYLTSIEIPDSVTSIGNYAFYGCTSLTSIEIPNSVTYIGSRAFEGCSGLKWINVETNNTRYSSLKGVLYSKDRVTLIKYPEGCKNKCFVLPEETLSIAEGVFKNAIITKIFIHNHLTSLGIIDDLCHIDEVHIRVEDPNTIDVTTFDKIVLGTLYVPIGTGYAYRHHPVFSRFKEVIIESEEEYRRKIE